jgi:hypothetical protein
VELEPGRYVVWPDRLGGQGWKINLPDPFKAAIEQAHYYRDVCLAAATAKYSFMAREHQRLALTAAIPS